MKETPYYLEEIRTPTKTDAQGNETHYQFPNFLYSFQISDDPNYAGHQGVYVYHNNDILTARNYPDEGDFKITKYFTGNIELTDEQKNAITFKLEKQRMFPDKFKQIQK